MLCPSCGKTIADGSTFCPRCEAKLTSGKKVAALIPCRQGDKWGFCDRDRKMVVPALYDSAEPFSNGLARVNLNGKVGFVDTRGNMTIPAVYDNADDFCEALARVKLNGEYGYIDAKGNMAIPAVYDGADSFA